LSPTLIIGATTVKPGMQKDAVIAVLSAQCVIKPSFPNCKGDNPVCHAYSLFETDNFPAGNVEFDKTGSLVRASVERLVGWGAHTDVRSWKGPRHDHLELRGRRAELFGRRVIQHLDRQAPPYLFPQKKQAPFRCRATNGRDRLFRSGSRRVREIAMRDFPSSWNDG